MGVGWGQTQDWMLESKMAKFSWSRTRRQLAGSHDFLSSCGVQGNCTGKESVYCELCMFLPV